MTDTVFPQTATCEALSETEGGIPIEKIAAQAAVIEKQNAELIEALSELAGAIRFIPIGTRALYALRAADILLTEIKELKC